MAPRDALQAILRLWTTDAQRLTQGDPALADTEPELALRPAGLTVTVGFGPGLFDRTNLLSRRPASARALPLFSIDRLEPGWGPTDLLLQICADDPLVIAHAARVLVKNVRTLAVARWRQIGFRSARGADRDGLTGRNLMGQLDGTVNPVPGTTDFDEIVWCEGDSQPWLAGGTLMVLRRIRMNLDLWDELDRGSRELVLGRRMDTGGATTRMIPSTRRYGTTGYRSFPRTLMWRLRIHGSLCNGSCGVHTISTTRPRLARSRIRD